MIVFFYVWQVLGAASSYVAKAPLGSRLSRMRGTIASLYLKVLAASKGSPATAVPPASSPTAIGWSGRQARLASSILAYAA